MKKILTVLFGVWLVCGAAEPQGVGSSIILSQRLAEVRAAIQKYCDEVRPTTRDPLGVAGIIQSDVAEKLYRVLLADCTTPPPLAVGTEVTATTLSPKSTRLEVRTRIATESVGDVKAERRRDERDSKILKRIIEILEKIP